MGAYHVGKEINSRVFIVNTLISALKFLYYNSLKINIINYNPNNTHILIIIYLVID